MMVAGIELPDELVRRLRLFSGRSKQSPGDLITRAVRELLDREEQPTSLDVRDALEDLRNGRVVDGDIVVDWIQSWGSDHELPRPKVD